MAMYTKLQLQLLAAVLILQAVAWYCFTSARSCSWCSLQLYIFGSTSISCTGVSLAYIWALWHGPPRYDTFLTFQVILLFVVFRNIMSYLVTRRAKNSWKNPRQSQEQLLRQILEENADTEYGKRYNFKDIKSLEEFRKLHPLTSYEHFRSYVERMMDGETNVLLKKTPAAFVRTTGTTGKPKYIPYIDKSNYIEHFGNVMTWYLNENHTSIGPLQKMMFFYVHPKVTKAKSGASIETIGSFPDIPEFLLCFFPTPGAGLKLMSTYEANYIHFLFGLRDVDVGIINIGFMTFFECACNQLKDCWTNIVDDIEHGTINPRLAIPTDIRTRLTKHLGAGDPERARELRQEFGKGFTGILKRVWPRLRLIVAIDHSGIWPRVERTFAKGISWMQTGYACSEGFYAVDLGPKYLKQPGYIPFPSVLVQEFIREEDIHQIQPSTLFLDELEVGQSYEVVLTQGSSGLYRYRLGDVIRIVDFHENCPVFQFMYRLGQLLNLHYEKLDMKVVEGAIGAAVARWGVVGDVDFTVAESPLIPEDSGEHYSTNGAPYYLIFLEFQNESASVSLSEDQQKMVDEELRHRNADYDRLRREGSISTPRVYVLQPGAFVALQDFIVNTSDTSIMQYKPPKKLRAFPMLDFMRKQVLDCSSN